MKHLYYYLPLLWLAPLLMAPTCTPVSSFHPRRSIINQPWGNISKPNTLFHTYFGDVNGDGIDDLVQFDKNRIFAANVNFRRDGILHKYLDVNIKRLVLGDFTTSGREHGRVQVIALTTDNSLICYSSSDDNRTLWWWFTQGNFIADSQEPLVGDFTGDGADDILVYDPGRGTLELWIRTGTNVFFQKATNFKLGNLEGKDLRNRQIYVGDFGQEEGRADLLIVNRANGQIDRYDSVTENGEVKFWWAFTTQAGFLGNAEQLAVGNLTGGIHDEVMIINGTQYKFFQAEFENNALKPIPELQAGNLAGKTGLFPQFGRFATWDNERGAHRDDLVMHNFSTNSFQQFDARFDPGQSKDTYWWAYSIGAPQFHRGWPDRKVDKWIIPKCRFTDVAATPNNDAYYNDLFTKSGEEIWGMYRYFHDQSYGGVGLDAKVPSGWKDMGKTHNWGLGNLHRFFLSNSFETGSNIQYWEFTLEDLGNNKVRLKCVDKYLCSSATQDGDRFWTWAPIPAGHDAYYEFEKIPAGNGRFRFKHTHSGKFITTESNSAGAEIVMKGPIPAGQESKFNFELLDQGGGLFIFKHQASGRYVQRPLHNRYFTCLECLKAYNEKLSDYRGAVSIYNAGDIDIGAITGILVNLHTERFDQNLVAHEMTHVYNLNHSWDDKNREYWDPWDVQGSTPDNLGRFVGNYASSGPGIHAWNKQKLGWIPEERMSRLPGDFPNPTEITLAELNRPECNGFMMVSRDIPFTGEKLFFELREPREWDQGFQRMAVYVRRIDGNGVSYLQAQGRGGGFRNGAQVLQGEKYQGFSMTMEVLEIDSVNGTARIKLTR
ncbi:MAG: VCBS repeat-containing protein [Bacteroidia bacterium]|nr:VCBS repeat-containing protein [Bacteroidia bacterium]